MIDADKHNFGKTVFRAGVHIFKPRSLFCEYQIYAEESTFRQKLNRLLPGQFEILPFLRFQNFSHIATTSHRPMEFLELKTIDRRLSDYEVSQIGGVLALMNILGVGDLHKTNILFGLKNDKLVFAPIDLEVFCQLFTISRMSLFGTSLSRLRSGGIDHFLTYLEKHPDSNFSAKILWGYKNTLSELYKHRERFETAFFEAYPKHEIPTRVVLKNTREYFNLISKGTFHECFREEIIQLERGDIPYFFRFIDGTSDIYFWESETRYQKVTSFSWLHSHKILSLTQGIKCEEMLADASVLTSAFDPQIGDQQEITSYKDIVIIHKKLCKLVHFDHGTIQVNRYLGGQVSG